MPRASGTVGAFLLQANLPLEGSAGATALNTCPHLVNVWKSVKVNELECSQWLSVERVPENDIIAYGAEDVLVFHADGLLPRSASIPNEVRGRFNSWL